MSYKMDEMIGEGSFGKVYLVEGTDGNKYVAKIYTNNDGDYDRDLEKNMMHAVSSVCEQYSACFVDSMDIDGYGAIMIMSYIDGKNVQKCIFGKERIPLEKRKNMGYKLMKQLILGLYTFHSLGLIHQDIKPENLIYTESGDVKYIDFGVSCFLNGTDYKVVDEVKVYDTEDSTCGFPGSMESTPPEMIEDHYPDNGLYPENFLLAHDIWSIACVILSWYTYPDDKKKSGPYESIYPVYSREFKKKDLNPYYSNLFTDLHNSDETAYKIVCGLMARDPDKRIQNFNEIVTYLNSWFELLDYYPEEWNNLKITKDVRKQLDIFRQTVD